ncbi:hypothetical protein LXL04_017597 [Taraxacum kok-saghyz]
MVTFAAPWCGFAKQLQPEFEKAAQNLQGKAKFGSVNCDVEKAVCGKYNINSYPTVLVFPAKDKANPVKYQGPRTATGIQDFVNSQTK